MTPEPKNIHVFHDANGAVKDSFDCTGEIRMDWASIQLAPCMNLKIGQPEYTPTIQFHSQDQGQCVMRLSKDGLWVDPDLTVDDAAKTVVVALDAHIKHVVAERDTALRQALEVLQDNRDDIARLESELYMRQHYDVAIAAIKGVLGAS
jgi:acyl-CoA reductase-like NAD-dependent aldehyde dehydrogenase